MDILDLYIAAERDVIRLKKRRYRTIKIPTVFGKLSLAKARAVTKRLKNAPQPQRVTDFPTAVTLDNGIPRNK